MTKIVECKVCGAPYQVYNMTVVDQSLCPECRQAQKNALENPTEEQRRERARRRSAAFR